MDRGFIVRDLRMWHIHIVCNICVAMRDETSQAATFASREVNPESGCVEVQPRGLTSTEMLRMSKFRRRQYRAMIQSAHAAKDAFRKVPRSNHDFHLVPK